MGSKATELNCVQPLLVPKTTGGAAGRRQDRRGTVLAKT